MFKSGLQIFSIYLLILLIFTGISCKKDEETDPLNANWKLLRIEKRETQPPVVFETPEELPISVSFGSINNVGIETYCNTGSANYLADGAIMTISNYTITEMQCPNDEPLDWEAIFSYNFVLTEYYFIEDNQLSLITTGEYNLIFTH